MMKQTLLTLTFAAATPALWAQTLYRDSKDPTIQTQIIYCDVYNLVSSDLGLFLGLGISFFGFVLLLTGGLRFKSLILLAGGIFLTALPGIFESLLLGTDSALSSLQDSNLTPDGPLDNISGGSSKCANILPNSP